MNSERALLRAIADYRMIRAGERIVIGASGGKDSLVLSYLLGGLRSRQRPAFSLSALCVIDESAQGDALRARQAALYAEWRIPLLFQTVPAATAAARNCYCCAAQRRKALMTEALR